MHIHSARVQGVAGLRHVLPDAVPLGTRPHAVFIIRFGKDECHVNLFEIQRREHAVLRVLYVEREEVDSPMTCVEIIIASMARDA